MKRKSSIRRLPVALCVLLAGALLAGCSAPPSPPGDESNPLREALETPPAPPPSEPDAVAALGAEARGMWVLAEGSQRVLEDPERIRPLLEVAEELQVTDLFVQVYRGGRSWYPSQIADPTPYREAHPPEGFDVFDLLLTQAHERGIRVHGWVNVLSLSARKESKILDELGPDAILVDSRGRSLLDYPDMEVPQPDRQFYRMGTRGLYLDAGAPGVAERLVATFVELIETYPTLDGLHLDYIRHPGALPFIPGSRFGVGLDFGYGPASRKRFQEETGLAGPFRDPENPDPTRLVNQNAWDDWRRQKVTDLVREIGISTRAISPALILSAAVNSYVDRAYLSLSQDWLRWLEDGYIDLALPMTYTLDDRLLRYQVEHFARSAHADQIWPGLGVWLFAKRPAGAVEQIEIAQRAGAPAIVLFSYDSIADAPELLRTLAQATAKETEDEAAPAHARP
ncbi:MAG: family 10 glycosylhydrolase [Myxococcota bacterium]|nr:family 10 glycosylhydrolase [Myxococcota bacterium]